MNNERPEKIREQVNQDRRRNVLYSVAGTFLDGIYRRKRGIKDAAWEQIP